MFSYYAMKVLSFFLCLLPHGAAMALGTGLARLAWIFIPARRKALAREQVMRCLGVSEEEAARIARASSLRFGPMLMEVLRFPVMQQHMSDYVTLTGAVEELRAVVEEGRGAVFATSHSGNWELMGGAFAAAGFPLVGVAKRQSSAGMDRFINEYRSLVGIHVTYRSGVREMFRMIDEGWIIGLISDQDPALRDGVIVDFFGQPTRSGGDCASLRGADLPCVHPSGGKWASRNYRRAAPFPRQDRRPCGGCAARDAVCQRPHRGVDSSLSRGVVLAA